MPYTKGKKMPQTIALSLSADIQKIALDQQSDMLRDLGVSEPDIAKARAECEAAFSDKPFQALMEAAPAWKKLKKEFGF